MIDFVHLLFTFGYVKDIGGILLGILLGVLVDVGYYRKMTTEIRNNRVYTVVLTGGQ